MLFKYSFRYLLRSMNYIRIAHFFITYSRNLFLKKNLVFGSFLVIFSCFLWSEKYTLYDFNFLKSVEIL